MRKCIETLAVTGISLAVSHPCFAWGERGHDVVTRVAVERLAEKTEDLAELNQPFQQREHMLAHLSNVPDIVWRAEDVSDEARALNAPTHYLDIDDIYPNPESLDDIELAYESSRKIAAENGFDIASQVGTAPWRVLQLYREMSSSFRAAGGASNKEERVLNINQALAYAGIMSHFVGDLANPHHTTKDHDGWMTGNGGLHAYFESHVVGALPIDLIVKVSQRSGNEVLEARLKLQYNAQEIAQIMIDPEKLIFALTLDSYQSLRRLVELDNSHSLISKSIDHSSTSGIRKRAERKSPTAVVSNYESFATERLAMGASVLSQLWLLAWEEAGKPDLSEYQSYWYPVKPDFIPPDYIAD